MFATPMTFVITCVIVGLVLAGVVILRRSLGKASDSVRSCPQCQASNPHGAHFCSRCGQDLS